MTANLTLVVVAAVAVGAGVSLTLERSLSRVLIGLVMTSNGVNLMLLVASGPAGRAPLTGSTRPEEMSDPLPQALVLTAIVITLATTAFMLAMSHRNWQLNGHDDVQDDVEDQVVRRRATADVASAGYDLIRAGDQGAGDVETLSVHGEQPVRSHGHDGDGTAETGETGETGDRP
jgi:multicomponent Na+:H+ antiporter subunit C